MTQPRRGRRILVAIAAVLVVVLAVGSITVFTLLRRPLPTLAGDVKIQGLEGEVSVLRDEHGIPQVYAGSAHDLFLAQGYVHAQDRFFEMDYRRHLTAGRLSELVGENETALQADIAIRTMGWRRVAEQELPLLSEETRAYLQAYADGVNAYLNSRGPGKLALEYTVLGLQVEVKDPEPWTPVDSLAWLKAMAWDLGGYADELSRAANYSQLQRAYGPETAMSMVSVLYPAYDPVQNLPILPSQELVAEHAAAAAEPAAGAPDPAGDSQALDVDPDVWGAVEAAFQAVPNGLGTGDGIGSNSWVVSGEHTESGKPLLANDPHLGISQPGIWYQMGLHCTDVGPSCPFEVAGYSFAGLPAIVIGHNAELAWGFTNLGPDVTDLFLERVFADGTYLRDGERLPLTERTEVIKVNGGKDHEITVRSTPHGPIMSDQLDSMRVAGDTPVPEGSPHSSIDGYAVAMAWTALEPGRTADAIFMIGTAKDAADVAKVGATFEVPAQNIVFATAAGDIGYQAPGRVPVRENVPGPVSSDGSWPRPGWDPRYDWQGYVPAADMPHETNPAEGFIVAANQAVQAPGTEPFLTDDFDYGYRSQAIRDRIEAQISAGEKFTAADMNDIQMTSVNPMAKVLVPALLEIKGDDAFTEQAVDLLRGWDLRDTTDSAAAAYFNTVWTNILRLTFWDQVPESERPNGGDRWLSAVRILLDEPDNPWWDDRATLNVEEKRDEILATALKDAREQLTVLLGKDPKKWEWGQLHRAGPSHQVLGGAGVPGPVHALVNPTPRPVAGGSAIVDANGWDASVWDEDGFPIFDVTWVPSMRMVVDMADLDASTWVNLTGNSGHPTSDNYDDQFKAWATGETYAWPWSRAAVDEATVNTLTLAPPG